nr:hypothetical protein Q903MT_gene4598 [Picea sitchensis]
MGLESKLALEQEVMQRAISLLLLKSICKWISWVYC